MAELDQTEKADITESSAKVSARNFIQVPKNAVVDKAEDLAEQFVSSNNIEDPDEREQTKELYKSSFYESIRELMP